MRVKCESRRQAILDVAEEVFRERGFELSSMSEITARVGGSKATLYNYFASKEELFLEVMHRFAESIIKGLFDDLDAQRDVTESLRTFGEQFLGYICQPQLVAAMRVVYAESGRSELGSNFYERGPLVGMRKLSAYFEECIALGKLRPCQAKVAAQQFVAMLRAEIVEPQLFGVSDLSLLPSVKESVEHTVDTFIRAYAA